MVEGIRRIDGPVSQQEKREVDRLKTGFMYRLSAVPFSLLFGTGLVGIPLFLFYASSFGQYVPIEFPHFVTFAVGGFIVGTIWHNYLSNRKKAKLEKYRHKLMLRRAYLVGVQDGIQGGRNESLEDLTELRQACEFEIESVENLV